MANLWIGRGHDRLRGLFADAIDVSDIDGFGDSAPIVQVENLEKVYRGWSFAGRRRVDALRGVTLQAKAGEVFGLLGPNGAGKTTLIKILLGVVKPSRGKAALFGQPAGSVAARTRVGYLPESLSVDSHHTARSALKFYGQLNRMPVDKIRRRSDELLDLVGLAGRDKESVRRFSKGMRQRLGLAQALLHNPDLLVLDEPTDGLDPVGRSEVRKVIERLRDEGKTIFLNSHILQEVELVCSRVAVLAQGTIRGSGRIDEIAGTDGELRVLIETQFHGDYSERQCESVISECLQALGQKIESPPPVKPLQATNQTYRVNAAGDRRYRIEVVVTDQSTIDRIVDQLRSRQVSICRLEMKRPTLEDTFIKLVGQSDGDRNSADDKHVDENLVTAEIVEPR